MTTQELRELDAWIAEHVMGWKRLDSILKITKEGEFGLSSTFNAPHEVMIDNGYSRVKNWVPTDKSGDAMDVLKKCAEKVGSIVIGSPIPKLWKCGVIDWDVECVHNVEAETLELAICLFAKQLFSQTTK